MDINMGQHERSTNFLIKNVDRPLLYPGARITSSEYQQLAKDLYNLLIKKFQRGNIYSSYRDNIWGADLADIQLIRKSNKEVRFLQRVFNIYSKYAWNVALKNEKDIKITNAFQKILNKFCRKPKKIWVDQSGEFTKDQQCCGCIKIELKCTQYTMKESILLLRELSELWREKFTSIWLWYQKTIHQ